MRRRLADQATSWYRSFSHVMVFCDNFSTVEEKYIQKKAYPCQVQFIRFGDVYVEHLLNSGNEVEWFLAQPRFIPAIHKTYEMFPNASFYMFGDDDTYIFRPGLDHFIETLDPTQLHAYGKQYCSWDFIQYMKPKSSSCHMFLQGGAGVLFTNKILTAIDPYLLNCSEKFNSPLFAASMRFAICATRYLEDNVWDRSVPVDVPELFHSKVPADEVYIYGLLSPSITFHRMNSSDFKYTQKARYAEYKSKGRKFLADLGSITYTSQNISLFRPTYKINYIPGLRMYIPFLQKIYNASSNWKPIFGHNNALIGVAQKYGPFTMKLMFNDDVPFGKILPIDISAKDNVLIYKMQTPMIIPI